MPTEVATPRASTPTSPIGRLDSVDSLFGARFVPGQTLAGRYRIVGLLGRGGMGEVYRADDLTLGQSVSLKFLPRSLNENQDVLTRFHAEVRNARQVSHPNVCRVYDIGEYEGQLFLTMEYVDGEDLGVLLRRIGRLPSAKANEVARQLCAGLAAAHDRGVLHRDLKPSNVMVDGAGRVRITDFGLAVRAEEGASDTAGTPAYMSPEQFEGKPATVQSDLYALGLILFEIYAGQKAFEAASIAEWRSRHTQSLPPSPTTVDPDVDPAVERVILRCLQKDPSLRPSSALKAAAALPGGDPLEAALAAGETPSPAMVAAAGGEGAASTRRAWVGLAGAVLAIAAIVAVSPSSTDLGLSKISKSADVLKARAHEIAAAHGYDADPLDSDGWFFRNYDPLLYRAQNTPSTQWRREMSEWFPPLAYQFRQSPRWMADFNPEGALRTTLPPLEVSGMLNITLDAQGRLLGLRGMPAELDTSTVDHAEPEWATLFVQAGLDQSTFVATSPTWVPFTAYDVRRAWKGEAPWAPGVPLEVTAAAFSGQTVAFIIRGPWWRATRMTGPRQTRNTLVQTMFGVIGILVITTAVFFAQRNIKLGRGDHRGAIRLGVFLAIVNFAIWLVGAHHVGGQAEIGLFFVGLFSSLGLGAILMIIYLAVEPYVRRRMPELLIGWARVLEGRFRDPRVGRDALVGILLGAIMALGLHVVNGLPTWFSFPGQTTLGPSSDALVGGRLLAKFLLGSVTNGVAPGLFIFSIFCLLRILVRKQVIAIIVFGLLMFLINIGGESPTLELPYALLTAIVLATSVSRFGLLTIVFLFWSVNLFANVPLPPVPGAPYFTTSLLVIALILALLLYAFRISLGTRPLFGAIDD
jgi:serine/threonine-protein kinase